MAWCCSRLNVRSESQRLRAVRLPEVVAGTSIPKMLYQTSQHRELPKAIQENVEAMKAMNPEYGYRFFDDADMVEFIESNYGARVLASFRRINPKYGAARADLFRYLLIYKHGGVYLDIKSSFARPLRDIVAPNDRFVLSHWRNWDEGDFDGWGIHADLKKIPGGEFQQCHIIATAGHPFLKAVIESVLRNIDCYNPVLHSVGSLGVFRVTGPIAYTLAIAPLLGAHDHRLVDSHTDLGFVFSVYQADVLAHRELARSHHSRLTESVILTDRDYTLALALVNRLRGLRAMVMAGVRHSIPARWWRRRPHRNFDARSEEHRRRASEHGRP